MMASSVYVCRILILLSYLLPLLWAIQECGHEYLPNCPSSFDCGYLGKIHFPYTTTQRRDCGLLQINGCNDPKAPKTILTNHKGRRPFEVISVSHSISTESTILVRDLDLHERLGNKSCEAFSNNYTLPPPLASAFNIRNNGVLFRCNRTLHVMTPPDDAHFFTYPCGDDYDILYGYSYSNNSESHRLLLSENCSIIYFPMKDLPDNSDPFTFVTSEIILRVRLSDECSECYRKRTGHCRFDTNQTFSCHRDGMSRGLKMGLGVGLGFGIGVPVIVIIGWLIGRHCKRKYYSSNDQFESRDVYTDTYSNPDPENGSIYFGVPLFSYKELQEATNNFDHTRVLGDGGFGIVYYGKLRDGREVAVKQLYEHNFRRVEQFRNEVKILANLRHKNLVSLYGCTSRQSRDLLLVYEYISNGTVSSHLHHSSSSSSSSLAHAPLPLSWPTRLKIAIETASALAYLHASDIIHRDVKTNNILLDANFTVKVADFGLSRMFPNDASHVSTAPQGTPGYVDPEYYQCYQLTSKSDVYSFGVVLMELISSKAAVDMSRSKEEVNLSNLAVRKIQESAFGELVDPRLGMERDGEVRRMVVSVGELAFQCLQRDRVLRPSMDEVLEALKRIESGSGGEVDEEDLEAGEGEGNVSTVTPTAPPPPPPPMSPDWEEVELLKKMKPRPNSPNTVTDKWKSEATTPNVSH